MNIKIENITQSQIAYIRRCGAYGAENIKTMDNLKSWAAANDLMNENTVILGIAHDNIQVTKPENCRYDAGIILSNKTIEANDSIKIRNIIGGKYAVFTIEHTAAAMERAWVEIFPVLFKEEYSIDNKRPIMERYEMKQVANHICEICVPIL